MESRLCSQGENRLRKDDERVPETSTPINKCTPPVQGGPWGDCHLFTYCSVAGPVLGAQDKAGKQDRPSATCRERSSKEMVFIHGPVPVTPHPFRHHVP